MLIIKCPECGQQIVDDSCPCPNCGCPTKYFKYENITKMLKCLECDEMIDSELEYCPNCGCPMEIISKSDIHNEDLTQEEKKALLKAKREKRLAPQTTVVDSDIEQNEQEKIDRLKATDIESIDFIPEEQMLPKYEHSVVVKVVGVTFENRQSVIRSLIDRRILFVGANGKIVAEKNNRYDNYAVAVLANDGTNVGYLSKDINRTYFLGIQNGKRYEVKFIGISGGSDRYNIGLTIQIQEVSL